MLAMKNHRLAQISNRNKLIPPDGTVPLNCFQKPEKSRSSASLISKDRRRRRRRALFNEAKKRKRKEKKEEEEEHEKNDTFQGW